MARPTKLTSEVIEKLCQAIQLGSTYTHACAYAGVSEAWFYAAKKRGEDEIERRQGSRVKPDTRKWQTEQPYVEFLEDIKKAEGKAVFGWLAKIELAANDGNWQAAAWKLERRYPKEYGRSVQQVEHSGPEGAPLLIIDGRPDGNSSSTQTD